MGPARGRSDLCDGRMAGRGSCFQPHAGASEHSRYNGLEGSTSSTSMYVLNLGRWVVGSLGRGETHGVISERFVAYYMTIQASGFCVIQHCGSILSISSIKSTRHSAMRVYAACTQRC